LHLHGCNIPLWVRAVRDRDVALTHKPLTLLHSVLVRVQTGSTWEAA
jgi:hypothetical protein